MSVVLVTGGNRGIGLEVCKQLVSTKHTVILTSRSLANGERAMKDHAGKYHVLELSLPDAEQIEGVRRFVADRFGSLDVLINNAAIYLTSKGLKDLDLTDIRETMETNFYGPMVLTHALYPLLRASQNGRVINVSSGMGQFDGLGTGYAGYRLSKVGLNAQTIMLSQEASKDGIIVNSVCPGWVRTDMGGPNAHRSIAKGAETIVWMATTDESLPTGKFFRDKKVIPW